MDLQVGFPAPETPTTDNGYVLQPITEPLPSFISNLGIWFMGDFTEGQKRPLLLARIYRGVGI